MTAKPQYSEATRQKLGSGPTGSGGHSRSARA